MTPTLILYHGQCPDGTAAAAIAMMKFPQAMTVPLAYGRSTAEEILEDFPSPSEELLFLDFTLPREEMKQLIAYYRSVAILDHHQTSHEAEREGTYVGAWTIIDETRSGAGIAWDLFFADEPRPWWVNYIEDQDLNRFALENSAEVGQYLQARPLTEGPETFAVSLAGVTLADAVQFGRVLREARDEYVARQIRHVTLGKREVAVKTADTSREVVKFSAGQLYVVQTLGIVNASYYNLSPLLNTMLSVNHGMDIAVGWFVRGDGMMQLSLRSRVDGPDVAQIAESLGGGGHKHAAGIELAFGEGLALLRLWGGL